MSDDLTIIKRPLYPVASLSASHKRARSQWLGVLGPGAWVLTDVLADAIGELDDECVATVPYASLKAMTGMGRGVVRSKFNRLARFDLVEWDADHDLVASSFLLPQRPPNTERYLHVRIYNPGATP